MGYDTQFLRQFSGPQPGSLFVDRGEEGHYVFALHVDFFNPEGLNIHGASTSCGIISMACLNLRLDIRYKLENMYLAGIISGLKQPSLESLNHYIHPLINDLVDAWQRGIKFSNTACYPHGRLTHSAVTAVVCDLPAARHIASMAGVGSHFYCSACNCYHKSTCHIPYIHTSHPKFRMSDLIRSDPQICTGSVMISFFIHILFI